MTDALRKASFQHSLHQGSIFRLKGDIPFASGCYHLFVVLNYDIKTGDILFLVNGTSQLEKRWRALEDIKGIDAKSTTVYFKAGSYSFISKDTLFDCNNVHCVNIETLDLKNIMMITKDHLSKEDIQKFINATLSSPTVERSTKNNIQPSSKN